MDMPSPAVVGHFGPGLDQPLDDPLDGSPDLPAFEVERPIHTWIGRATRQNLEKSLPGLKTWGTREGQRSGQP